MKQLILMELLVNFFAIIASFGGTDFIPSGDGTAEAMKSHQIQSFKAETKVTLDLDQPYLFKFKDRLPILILPASDSSEVKIDSPQTRDVFKKNVEQEASKLLSPLMLEISQVQRMIQNKQYKEAMAQLNILRSRYPDVAFLEFTRGSLLALTGDRDAAIQATQKGLDAHPDYEEGREFLRKLKGDSK